METYATIAAKLLPCHVPFDSVMKTTFSESARASFYAKEDTPEQKRDDKCFERYARALSVDKWTSTRDISRSLHVGSPAVNHFLGRYPDRIEKRQTLYRGVVTNLWRLTMEVPGA